MSDEFRISRGGIPIPSIIEKPIKSLWKTYNYTLKDSASVRATWMGIKTRWPQCGLSGWNEHLAGGVFINLGEVLVPFVPSQRCTRCRTQTPDIVESNSDQTCLPVRTYNNLHSRGTRAVASVGSYPNYVQALSVAQQYFHSQCFYCNSK